MVVLKDVSYSEAKGMVENYLKGHENAYISMPIYRNKEDAIEGEVIKVGEEESAMRKRIRRYNIEYDPSMPMIDVLINK